ncbi:MAG: GGDEF domain-containing protein [Phycisphaerae bacterium]|nr:GGDEF domain-containing protein [Phycisphaerae bacterium]
MIQTSHAPDSPNTPDSAEDILLLGEPGVTEPLRAQLGRRQTVAFANAYDAMLALHDRPHRCVVVAATQPELPTLCRALRRVHARGPLLAVGGAAAEPAMRSLTPSPLDDYFISPPTRADVDRIRAGHFTSPAEAAATIPPHVMLDTHPPAAPVGAANGMVALAPAQWAELLAATSVVSVQEAVAKLLAACGFSASWRRADDLGAANPLLTLTGDTMQSLVAAEPHAPAPPEARALLAALGQLLGPLAKNAVRIESLHKLAITDHLTGAYNRRYFYHLTEQILTRAAKANGRVTLLLYDIDDFKHYNEKYGHAAGDEILRQTAVLMKKTSRVHDIVARIGGDEFAVLFWDADPPRSPNSKPLETFAELAERFRQAVRDHSFSFLGPDAKGSLSISGGLAHFPGDGQGCRDLLRTADAGLRAAKRQGKNRIYLVGQDEE